jgi:hypothetical protein
MPGKHGLFTTSIRGYARKPTLFYYRQKAYARKTASFYYRHQVLSPWCGDNTDHKLNNLKRF